MEGRRKTKTEELVTVIRRKVALRTLGVGERLPSIRSFAIEMKCSPSTVVQAYDRLAADGVIRSLPGSGFYVLGPAPPLAMAEAEPRLHRAIDPLWVSRQSLDLGAQVSRPGCGWLPPDWMPVASIRRATRGLARASERVLTEYGSTRGSLALRVILARRLAEEGLEVGADRILLTQSGTQAIDLVCRFFLSPGDTVLVDDPCYFNFRALLRAHQVKVVGVPYTPHGPDLRLFEAAIETHHPRLYLTNSAIHNPTGATMSPRIAHGILSAAAGKDLIIVEDDIFGEFEPEPSPRLAALDGLTRVVRIGSYSKVISASVRCGYIASRAEWIEGLLDLQVATNFGGPSPIAVEILRSTLTDGGFRKHTDALRRRLWTARQEVAEKLSHLSVRPWVVPRGGPFLWCRLPPGRDAAAIAEAALRESVIFAPGDVFSVSQSAAGFMRFNVAQMSDARVFTVLDRLLRPRATETM